MYVVGDSFYFCYPIISECDGADEIGAVYMWVMCMAHLAYYLPSHHDVGYLVGQWRAGAVPNRGHWMARAQEAQIANLDYVVRKYA